MRQDSEVQVGESEVLSALSRVMDPELGKDLVSLDIIKGVRIDGGRWYKRRPLPHVIPGRDPESRPTDFSKEAACLCRDREPGFPLRRE